MRLEKASAKAIRYACLKFHYAKAVPQVFKAFNVFNNKKEWCGVICYGIGATANIGMPFGLTKGTCVELVRVALNGKQKNVSSALSLSLKLVKKDCPLLKMVVSYADSEQKHKGIIYRATNWYYVGSSTDTNLIINGVRMHRRSISSKYGTSSLEKLQKKGLNVEKLKTKPKHKYIYPLTKDMRELCKKLAKPYPK